MNNANLKLSPVRIDQLDQVTKIHMDAFRESFLSQVGYDAVQKYYKWLMTPPNECYANCVFNEEELLGFCYAGVFRNAEVHFIKENALFLFGEIITKPQLWFSKMLWKRLGSSVLAFSDYFKPRSKEEMRELEAMRKARFGILSIAVDEPHQGLGIGGLLEHEVERTARSKGYSRIVLSVHPDNQKAVKFYKKRGWYEIYPDPTRAWQGYMEKIVSPDDGIG